MPADPLLLALTARVRSTAHPSLDHCACGTDTLADRPDATVVRHADTVAKAHASDTSTADLALRLALATHLPEVLLPPLTPTPTVLHGRLVTLWPYGTPVDPQDPDAAPWEAAATLLAHLHRTPIPTPTPSRPTRDLAPTSVRPVHGADPTSVRPVHGADPTSVRPVHGADPTSVRPVHGADPTSVRPVHGADPTSVRPTGDAAPTSLPPVHSPAPAPLPSTHSPTPTPTPPLPHMRGPLKAARAVARLREADPHPAAAPILQAWDLLPPWARAEAPMPDTTTLCHGDLHLGQLVRSPAPDGPWLLIDVDDLGVGVPAWDLARPAAWYACGLLPPDEWSRFLTAYREAHGPAVPAQGDPWPALDVPARALTVQTAARALTKAITQDRPLDEVEQSLVDACARMRPVPPQLLSNPAK
ncbi:phosphotransferase [Streptomyces sp. NPDC048751]|uniref:phosphotransferase family protein n=1 Tax=Streptomyces sp. NPDC048751 TaxID=3365591 RepID=UPI00371161AF